MLRIVFFGTPRFSATVLDYLLAHNVEILAVVTKPSKPRGRSGTPRPPPVKELAESEGIPVYQPQKASDPSFAEKVLRPLQADLFVVVAYSEILKENLLTMPRLGCVNVHASILPKYRGAAPIQRAVMAGEKESGVTIMSMAKELDAGDIYAIVKTPITEDMTSGDLSEMLSHIGAEALWHVLEELEKGSARPIEQNAGEATYAKKLAPEEGEVDWQGEAQKIYNQIRGVTPKPGAWCWVECRGKRKRFLIKKARQEPSLHGKPGELLAAQGLVVACEKGAIRLLEVQLEGKKSLNTEQFLLGIAKKELDFRKKSPTA